MTAEERWENLFRVVSTLADDREAQGCAAAVVRAYGNVQRIMLAFNAGKMRNQCSAPSAFTFSGVRND